MNYIIFVATVIVPILGRPQGPPAAAPAALAHAAPHPAGDNTTPVTIVSQTDVVGVDGAFNYSYELSNGVRVEEGGYVKKGENPPQGRSLDANATEESGDVQVIQGSYSYTAPDGQKIVLKYIADENGFQPEGDHLPTTPAAPAVPGAAPAGAASAPLAPVPVQHLQHLQQLQQHQEVQQSSAAPTVPQSSAAPTVPQSSAAPTVPQAPEPTTQHVA